MNRSHRRTITSKKHYKVRLPLTADEPQANFFLKIFAAESSLIPESYSPFISKKNACYCAIYTRSTSFSYQKHPIHK
jgi:hypothetical protein